MNRSRWILRIALLAALGAPCGRLIARTPNIIFVMADDLGYADIGAFGQSKIRTPHIDRLATEGTRFTNYYAGSAVCAPTRCCVMTGKHSGHATVRHNHGEAGLSRVPLRPEDVTVAEVLKGAGYATGMVGKWGLGEEGTDGVPTRQGFDLWFGYLNQDHAEDYYTEKLYRGESPIAIKANRNGARGAFSNDLMQQEALAFIQANRAKPFFLYAAYTIPHAILEVPADSLREYENSFPDDPAIEQSKTKVSRPRQTYAAMISRLDRYVGEIMARLRELGLDDDTLVFFCSDNGATNKANLGPYFNSNGPLTGWKRSLSEGGIRAPMIVRWPGRVAAGKVSDMPWAGWDVLPTLAEIAGVTTLPEGIDGISVGSMLRGGVAPQRPYFYWEMPAKKEFGQAVRIGDMKAVRHAADRPIEVYDLRADLAETRDLAAAQPAFVARAHELFRTARTHNSHYPVTVP